MLPLAYELGVLLAKRLALEGGGSLRQREFSLLEPDDRQRGGLSFPSSLRSWTYSSLRSFLA